MDYDEIIPDTSRSTASKYTSQNKYDKLNTKSFSLKLNNLTDKDILEWLETQNNKQGAIKEAIRKSFDGRDYENELYILDGITKCVLRYANSISTGDKNEMYSDWCIEYRDYLNNRRKEIMQKLYATDNT